MQKKQQQFHITKIQTDLSPTQIKSDAAMSITNMRINNTNGKALSLSLEAAYKSDKCTINSTDYEVLYGLNCSANLAYLFLKSGNSSAIASVSVKKGGASYEYNIIYSSTDTDFFGENIQAKYIYETDKIQKIYWIDDSHQPRVINLCNTYEDVSSKLVDFVPEVPFSSSINITRSREGGSWNAGCVMYFYTCCIPYLLESNIVQYSDLYYLTKKNKGISPEYKDKSTETFNISVQVNDKIEDSYTHIRLYRITYSSLNQPQVYDLGYYKIEDPDFRTERGYYNSKVTVTDNGDLNENAIPIDASHLRFKGLYPIQANTFEVKDNHLLIGGYKLNNYLLEDNTTYITIDTIQDNKDINSCYNKLTLTDSTFFHKNELYKIGVQFMNKYGVWSNIVNVIDYIPTTNLNKIIFTINKWGNNDAVAARAVCNYPSEDERNFIAEGAVNTSIFSVSNNSFQSDYILTSDNYFKPSVELAYNKRMSNISEDDLAYYFVRNKVVRGLISPDFNNSINDIDWNLDDVYYEQEYNLIPSTINYSLFLDIENPLISLPEELQNSNSGIVYNGDAYIPSLSILLPTYIGSKNIPLYKDTNERYNYAAYSIPIWKEKRSLNNASNASPINVSISNDNNVNSLGNYQYSINKKIISRFCKFVRKSLDTEKIINLTKINCKYINDTTTSLKKLEDNLSIYYNTNPQNLFSDITARPLHVFENFIIDSDSSIDDLNTSLFTYDTQIPDTNVTNADDAENNDNAKNHQFSGNINVSYKNGSHLILFDKDKLNSFSKQDLPFIDYEKTSIPFLIKLVWLHSDNSWELNKLDEVIGKMQIHAGGLEVFNKSGNNDKMSVTTLLFPLYHLSESTSQPWVIPDIKLQQFEWLENKRSDNPEVLYNAVGYNERAGSKKWLGFRQIGSNKTWKDINKLYTDNHYLFNKAGTLFLQFPINSDKEDITLSDLDDYSNNKYFGYNDELINAYYNDIGQYINNGFLGHLQTTKKDSFDHLDVYSNSIRSLIEGNDVNIDTSSINLKDSIEQYINEVYFTVTIDNYDTLSDKFAKVYDDNSKVKIGYNERTISSLSSTEAQNNKASIFDNSNCRTSQFYTINLATLLTHNESTTANFLINNSSYLGFTDVNYKKNDTKSQLKSVSFKDDSEAKSFFINFLKAIDNTDLEFTWKCKDINDKDVTYKVHGDELKWLLLRTTNNYSTSGSTSKIIYDDYECLYDGTQFSELWKEYAILAESQVVKNVVHQCNNFYPLTQSTTYKQVNFPKVLPCVAWLVSVPSTNKYYIGYPCKFFPNNAVQAGGKVLTFDRSISNFNYTKFFDINSSEVNEFINDFRFVEINNFDNNYQSLIKYFAAPNIDNSKFINYNFDNTNKNYYGSSIPLKIIAATNNVSLDKCELKALFFTKGYNTSGNSEDSNYHKLFSNSINSTKDTEGNTVYQVVPTYSEYLEDKANVIVFNYGKISSNIKIDEAKIETEFYIKKIDSYINDDKETVLTGTFTGRDNNYKLLLGNSTNDKHINYNSLNKVLNNKTYKEYLKSSGYSDSDLSSFNDLGISNILLNNGKIPNVAVTEYYLKYNPNQNTEISLKKNINIPIYSLYRKETPNRDNDTKKENLEWNIASKIFYKQKSDYSDADNIGYIEIGDCFYSRYDHLLTEPYNEEIMNQLVDIDSFDVVSHNNLLGIYDSRHDLISHTQTRSTNFNKFNSVYNQKFNFFYAQYVADIDKENTNFNSQIIYSLNKIAGSKEDLWTNINPSTGFYDAPGNLGKITNLVTNNNKLYAFQERGIDYVSFNSRVQIPVSDGVPIEMSNSGKLDTIVTVSDTYGCNKLHQLVNTQQGIYFINSFDNQFCELTGDGQLLDVSRNDFVSNIFTNNNIALGYDLKNKEIYINANNDSYIYSLLYKSFIGAFSYPSFTNTISLQDYSIFISNGLNIFRYYSDKFFANYNIQLVLNIDKTILPESIEFDSSDKDNNGYHTNTYTSYSSNLLSQSGDKPFTSCRINNDYQGGEIYNKTLIRKYRTWRWQIGKDYNRNRYCDKYLAVNLFNFPKDYDNPYVKDNISFYDFRITYWV